MANLSERTVHHVNHVESLSKVRQELFLVKMYLKWIKATILFRQGTSTFWVTPDGRTLELEISPRNDGWQIILLE